MEAMNLKIVNANIELQDENKVLKEDKKILQKRIDKAIEYIKIQQKIFKDYDIAMENQLKNVLEILKGEVINE